MERKVIKTGDGSKTIQLVEWNEQYHSVHGALQEAKHVFIDKFNENLSERKELKVFEMGMGTGLNAFLTAELAQKLQLKVHYLTLEAFPVHDDELEALDYATLLNDRLGVIRKIHNAEWGRSTEINLNFTIEKVEQKLEDFNAKEGTMDFVFYDAFGPRVQPELWTKGMFSKMYSILSKEGVFLTYCAKGQVRRDLVSVGFRVSRLPGPPGKREMLLGRK